jgi:myo-inositol 2-dehydrogenase/D-chiro-inositol 1-dehydrogenase
VVTRVGFIGSGAVAARHALTLTALPDVHVGAVVSRRAAHAEAFAHRFSARAFDTVERLLDEGGCDVVYICVPPFAHGRIEELVIAARLPFFVEKPLSHDLDTAERIAAKLAANPVLTSVGYQWRYSRSVDRAAALLRTRIPLLVRAQWLDRTPPPPWWSRPAQSGGQVVEQGTHLLDVLRVLAGEVHEVTAAAVGPAQPGGVDRAVAATLRFVGGAVGSFCCSSVLGHRDQVGVEIVCDDGLLMRVGQDRLECTDGDRTEVLVNEIDPRVTIDEVFVAAVRAGDGSPIRASYAEAVQTERLAWEVTTASRLRARAASSAR